MVLTEILVTIGVIVVAIGLIIGFDWIAIDAARELEDWIKSRLKKSNRENNS
jgi:hypothetical protein